ncbi:MAG: phosphate butyryltransferase [candidate division Zixibacteria bacterium]|nr:phosphate butyryltransferase [candidate division Zixibacteria bacterium]
MTLQKNPIHSSDELVAHAIAIADAGRKKTVAVAAAQDADVIGAVAQAQADGFINAILVGDATAINKLAKDNKIDIGHLEVIDEPDISKAAHQAARLASEKKADLIMKGFLPTSALLRTVLDKKYELRGKTTLSHCAVLDIPGYHKLLNFTDGGMVVRPDPEAKLMVLENAIMVGRALGLSPVKVAVSAAIDRLSDRMPHTLTDHDYVIPQAMKKFDDIVIQGPLTFDLATSSEAAGYYTSTGPVVGDADIFLVDSIEECNIVCKALIGFAQAVFAGVIVGAKVPVSLVSRTDTIKNKKASLAIACLLADYYDQSQIWDD